jgi:hypothetical protein
MATLRLNYTGGGTDSFRCISCGPPVYCSLEEIYDLARQISRNAVHELLEGTYSPG